jgi:hypothetical protein
LEGKVNIQAISGLDDFCDGLPSGTIHSLNRLISRRFDNVSIFISHKPPPSYPKFPYHGVNDVKINTFPKYVIGRSMYESTMIPLEWATKANKIGKI